MQGLRKLTIFALILVLLTGGLAGADQPVLVFVHPHTQHLKTFDYLMDNKIIEVPDMQIIAVYYDQRNYNVKRVNKFIENNNYSFISTEVLTGELSAKNLYQQNELTDDYNKLFQKSDGIVFLGGADIPPRVYDSKTNLLTNISTPYRHYFELSFLYHLLGSSRNHSTTPLLEENPDYVITGFCLGMQTMNIATGGTMYQDIPSEIYNIHFVEDVLAMQNDQQHRNYNISFGLDNSLSWGHLHRIKFKSDFFPQLLGEDYNEHPFVYSSHHQALRKLGQSFQIAALAMDGRVVEAITHTKYPNVIGVQFHPEVLEIYQEAKDYKTTPESDPVSLRKLIEKKDSYKFHLKFWEFFSRMMQ